jgi:TIR domain
MLQVFVSYSRDSEALVKALVADLDELGHGVWFDKDLVGGQAWWDQILGRIRACDVLVFVLDEKSLASGACRAEWLYAAALGKTILPVLVADGVSSNLLPPALQQTHFIDYRRQDRQAALRLARALADSPLAGALPDPLPAAPDLPISYLGRLGYEIDAPEMLGRERQSALLVDLKRALRDAETRADAQALLRRMRKRHDLLMTVGEEIDELFAQQGANAVKQSPAPAPVLAAPARELAPGAVAAPVPPAPAATPPSIAVPLSLAAMTATVATETAAPIPTSRPHAPWGLKIVLVAGIVGTVAGVIAMSPTDKGANAVWGLLTGAGAAIGMAISRRSRRAPLAIAVGAALAWVAVTFYFGSQRQAFSLGGVFGAPVGAILGGLVARLRSRRETPALQTTSTT